MDERMHNEWMNYGLKDPLGEEEWWIMDREMDAEWMNDDK
jgi:hypothetical protein